MSTFDHFDRAFDRIFNPPEPPEMSAQDEAQLRTDIAHRLDTEVLEPEEIMHMAESGSAIRQNLYLKFRQQAANAIDLQTPEAYEKLGATAAEIIFRTLGDES